MGASPTFSDGIVMPPAAHTKETFVDDEYLLDGDWQAMSALYVVGLR